MEALGKALLSKGIGILHLKDKIFFAEHPVGIQRSGEYSARPVTRRIGKAEILQGPDRIILIKNILLQHRIIRIRRVFQIQLPERFLVAVGQLKDRIALCGFHRVPNILRGNRHVGVKQRRSFVHLSFEHDFMKGIVDRLFGVDRLPLAAVDGIFTFYKDRLIPCRVDLEKVVRAVRDQSDQQQNHDTDTDKSPFSAAEYLYHTFTSRSAHIERNLTC